MLISLIYSHLATKLTIIIRIVKIIILCMTRFEMLCRWVSSGVEYIKVHTLFWISQLALYNFFSCPVILYSVTKWFPDASLLSVLFNHCEVLLKFYLRHVALVLIQSGKWLIFYCTGFNFSDRFVFFSSLGVFQTWCDASS